MPKGERTVLRDTRLQIRIGSDMLEGLRRVAREKDIDMSEHVRELIRKDLVKQGVSLRELRKETEALQSHDPSGSEN